MALFMGLGALAHASDTDAPTANKPTASMDIDGMAARFKDHQDLYRKIRDDGYAAMDASHLKPDAVEPMKSVIRNWAYQWVWGDRYSEGLVRQASKDALLVQTNGGQDWLGNMALQATDLQTSHSAADTDAHYVNFSASNVLCTGYPAPFKMQACLIALGNLADYKTEGHAAPASPEVAAIPAYIAAWGKGYRELIQAKWPHDLLYDEGACLLCKLQNDESSLNLAIAEIDRSYNEADPENPVRIALDGTYFTDAAWCARGSDWAGKVTDQGWKLFAERLAKADTILEAGFAKYPQEGEMAVVMLTVELGQGQGRDRMEAWFQKAIKVNPDDYDAYSSKDYYLQPKWYGSIEDLLTFGQEAEKTDRWDSMIATILTKGLAIDADNDDSVYKRDDVWPAVEKNYREFLRRYPKSVGIRTYFAKHAYDGGHLDIAREQFKILGPDWDPTAIDGNTYGRIMMFLNAK